MFNPRAQLQLERFTDDAFCLVIDDALLEPERLVQYALDQRAAFRAVDFNAYPGIYMPAPAPLVAALEDYFVRQLRRRFDARRVLDVHCRFSMVTTPPQALRPNQWLCHRDSGSLEARQSVQASVLYLFADASLGGTSFYRPRQSAAETARLFHDAATLPPPAFAAKYAIEPGYIHDSNRHFERIGSIAARWNRLIVYDGSLLHSGDITAPEKLSADPRTGRLTLNGFFTSRRNAA